MRSSITLTSAPRPLNGASRWHSMKRTPVSPSRADRSAGLKRSTWPTWSLRPRRAASFVSSAASRLVRVIGFSTSTCTPCSRKNLRELEMRRRARGDRDRVDVTDELAVVGEDSASRRFPRRRGRPPRRDRRRRRGRRRRARGTSAHETGRGSRRRRPPRGASFTRVRCRARSSSGSSRGARSAGSARSRARSARATSSIVSARSSSIRTARSILRRSRRVEARALEPDAIHGARRGPVALGDRERRDVLVRERAGREERVRADTRELRDAGETAHERVVLDRHVARELRAVHDHDVLRELAVVADVRVRHDEVVVADAA